MHLMYTIDPATGKRKYTLKKVVDGELTKSAHPARFSPDDKWSRQRITIKKRHGLLLTQKRAKEAAEREENEKKARADRRALEDSLETTTTATETNNASSANNATTAGDKKGKSKA